MFENIMILVVVPVLLLCIAAITLMGKGDWMISPIRRMSAEERAKYNLVRVRVVSALLLLYLAIALPIVCYLQANEYVMLVVIIPPAILHFILFYTWCKR